MLQGIVLSRPQHALLAGVQVVHDVHVGPHESLRKESSRLLVQNLLVSRYIFLLAYVVTYVSMIWLTE